MMTSSEKVVGREAEIEEGKRIGGVKKGGEIEDAI
jgi:hypothetical protein